MTVNQTKERIEKELLEVKNSFGEASYLVNCSVEVEENNIEGAPVDVTAIFGSLSIGLDGAEENDRLYLPLDAELDDDDNVDEATFEKNLESFKSKVNEIRDRILASDDYDSEVKAVIADFDRDMEEKYQAELERLNRAAKKHLTVAAVATAVCAVIAILILAISRLK
jgi:uncharacterized protein YukE